MTNLELDLVNIRELRHIRWTLRNWSNEAGQWHPICNKQ